MKDTRLKDAVTLIETLLEYVDDNENEESLNTAMMMAKDYREFFLKDNKSK